MPAGRGINGREDRPQLCPALSRDNRAEKTDINTGRDPKMAIEAPMSKFTKTNFKIYIGVCLFAAGIFAYDGYLSKYEWSKRYSFYKEHVLDNDGKPSPTMEFKRKSPPVFLAIG